MTFAVVGVAAHQPAGVQAAEAPTVNPAASEAQISAVFSKTSSWTGLVNLDKTENSTSSEISEEHVVIHLRPEESWTEKQDSPTSSQPSQEESEGPKSSNALGLSDLESLESHGGSAHEEEDGTSFGSDPPTLSPLASSTPQPQTSNSVLTEFVNTLMKPFRYWTGGETAEETEKGLPVPEDSRENNQAQGGTSSRNLSVPKPSGNKGSMDNAIIEHRGGSFSIGTPTSGLQNSEEGLSEQEKEVTPLIQLVPAVQNTGESNTSTQPEETSSTPADNSMSTITSKTHHIFYLCVCCSALNLKQTVPHQMEV